MLNRSTIISGIIGLYLILEYFHVHQAISSSTIESMWFITISTLGFLLFLLYYHGLTRILVAILVFIITASVFLVVNTLMYGGHSIGMIIPLVSQIGFGLALTLYRRRGIFVIYMFILLFLTTMATLQGSDLNDVTIWSRNTISVYAIVTFTMYYIATYNRKPLSDPVTIRYDILLMLGLTVLTSILGIGRGGIISSSLLIVGVVLMQFSRSRVAPRVLLVLAIVIAAYGIIASSYYLKMLERTKFLYVGLESPRLLYLATYYQHLGDIKRVIFGSNLTDVVFRVWEGNPHNSYIRLHMQMGAAVFLFLGAMVHTLVIFFRKREYLLFFCLAALSVRAFTDMHLLTGNNLNFGVIVALWVIGQKLVTQPKSLHGSIRA